MISGVHYEEMQKFLITQGFEFRSTEYLDMMEIHYPNSGVWWGMYEMNSERGLYLAAFGFWLRHYLGYGVWRELYKDWQVANRFTFDDATESAIGQMFIYCKILSTSDESEQES